MRKLTPIQIFNLAGMLVILVVILLMAHKLRKQQKRINFLMNNSTKKTKLQNSKIRDKYKKYPPEVMRRINESKRKKEKK